MGVAERFFWNSNPRLLKPYRKAYELLEKKRSKDLDYMAWLMGLYNLKAFEVPLTHFGAGLGGKSTDAKYHEKPISLRNKIDADGNEILPQEEQMERVKMLFSALEIRKTNFELSKKEGSGE